jgi:hypothetical protein
MHLIAGTELSIGWNLDAGWDLNSMTHIFEQREKHHPIPTGNTLSIPLYVSEGDTNNICF